MSEVNYKGIWIIAEHEDGKLKDVSLELIQWGRKLADKLKEEISALIFGSEANISFESDSSTYIIDKVYAINDLPQMGYTAEVYTEAMANLVDDKKPRVILFGCTTFGRDLAARLAAKLKIGLASDCTGVEVSANGLISFVRPIYGGQIDAQVVIPEARPQIATFRVGITQFKPVRERRKAEVIRLDPEVTAARSQKLGLIKADPKTLRLDEAEVIVAGGGGIDSSERFQMLDELAKVIGGCIGASRVLVDREWVTTEKQIGQTGYNVAPKLYLGFGISGSIYHTMGMKDSKFIVVINKDRNAPFFKLADISIVGDCNEILTALVKRLHGVLEEK